LLSSGIHRLLRLEILPLAALILVDFLRSLLTGLGVFRLSKDPTESMAYGILFSEGLALMAVAGAVIAGLKKRFRSSLPWILILAFSAPLLFTLSHKLEKRLIRNAWWERHECTPESLLKCAQALYKFEVPRDQYGAPLPRDLGFFRERVPELRAHGLSPEEILISGISILGHQSFELMRVEWKIRELSLKHQQELIKVLEYYVCPLSPVPEAQKTVYASLLGNNPWPCKVPSYAVDPVSK
jgi:hypothetical protein